MGEQDVLISLTLEIPPVAASRPRFSKWGTYNAPKYERFKKQAKLLLSAGYRSEPLAGPLEVNVAFNFEKPKSAKRPFPSVKPDIDNLLKAIFDAANGVLWEDDAQIVATYAVKRYGKPSINITLCEVTLHGSTSAN